jgi:hypothetical protein
LVLFGYHSRPITREFKQILDKDLISSLSPHTLYQRISIFPGGVEAPLLVCASQDDAVIDPNLLAGWQPWLKESDRTWACPQGRYFFHAFHPQQTGQQILDFWRSQPLLPPSTNLQQAYKVQRSMTAD